MSLLSTIRAMTDKQRKYIETLIKKVFRNVDSQSEILSRLDRVKISSHQASVMIHALKLECNIGRSVPALIIGEDSDGMIQKSNGIGNWMKCHIKGVATKEQIRGFFAKVRKTQKIINY